jgi:protein-tyrosine-phosphatase
MLAECGQAAVQENFVGEGVGVELLLERGEPLMAFQHVRLHEPLHGGGSSYRKGVPVDPALFAASLALLRPLEYTGVAMVEFKVDSRTGDWVLIEVNGRFWGSLPLAISSGADFPLALFRLLVDGTRPSPRRVRPGIQCRNLVLDCRWMLDNVRADRTDPTLSTRPLLRTLAESCWSVLSLRERSDTFTLDDPVPGCVEVGQALRGLCANVRRRAGRWWAQTALARAWMAGRARSALARTRSVLFVCKGNICRSPFAEHLARRSLPPGWTVQSAGYFPAQGRQCPENAVAAAQGWDVDLSGHRSQTANETLIRDAGVIFVFDHENYVRLVADYGFARRKIFFLGSLCSTRRLFISDPYGSDRKTFEAAYGEIAAAVAAFAAGFRPGADSPVQSSSLALGVQS